MFPLFQSGQKTVCDITNGSHQMDKPQCQCQSEQHSAQGTSRKRIMRLLSYQKTTDRWHFRQIHRFICKIKFLCLARVEGETVRWRTTKKHAVGACAERRPLEQTPVAKQLESRKRCLHAPPAVESVSPASLGTMATPLPSATGCSSAVWLFSVAMSVAPSKSLEPAPQELS